MQRFLLRPGSLPSVRRNLAAYPSLNRFTSNAPHPNPGNFQDRPKEEVSEIGRRGGSKSGGKGFKSMDPDKQVRIKFLPFLLC